MQETVSIPYGKITKIHRYRSDGKHIMSIEIPSCVIMNCARALEVREDRRNLTRCMRLEDLKDWVVKYKEPKVVTKDTVTVEIINGYDETDVMLICQKIRPNHNVISIKLLTGGVNGSG